MGFRKLSGKIELKTFSVEPITLCARKVQQNIFLYHHVCFVAIVHVAKCKMWVLHIHCEQCYHLVSFDSRQSRLFGGRVLLASILLDSFPSRPKN